MADGITYGAVLRALFRQYCVEIMVKFDHVFLKTVAQVIQDCEVGFFSLKVTTQTATGESLQMYQETFQNLIQML